jgi:hypothetical protein
VLAILVSMLLITLVAGLVVVYVAHPHRGEVVPSARWLEPLGAALRRGAAALPVLQETEREPTSR